MPEKQMDMFSFDEDDPSRLPPIGSEWERIRDWADCLSWGDDIFCAVVFEVLGLHDPISMKFIRHMLWATKVFDIKQQNYGPENIARLGEDGIMSRVSDDKFSRLKTLNANPDQALDGEPALDAWHDSGVYGLIGAMVHCGDWPSREELGLNAQSLEEICKEAVESVASDGMTPADALRYIEENLVR